MGLFSRFFSRSAEDYLSKGDRLLESQQFYDARNVFEKGLECHLKSLGAAGPDELIRNFHGRIAQANAALAERNLEEAEHAIGLGSEGKAIEHLELAKSLTDDLSLREKAEKLLVKLRQKDNDKKQLAQVHSGGCSSCSSSHSHGTPDIEPVDHDMSDHDYYDLLIRQLPAEMYKRYAVLGENFACMFLAASRDEHTQALELLEAWHHGGEEDIYCYEKGMILYRLGRTDEAEAWLKKASRENGSNPLPYLGLALLLMDAERIGEAAEHLEMMIAKHILEDQAKLFRADVALMAGETDDAINGLVALLTTPLVRPAAEKLYGVLLELGREQDAKQVFKKYLGGCRH